MHISSLEKRIEPRNLLAKVDHFPAAAIVQLNAISGHFTQRAVHLKIGGLYCKIRTLLTGADPTPHKSEP
jgi:hypothetical protein